MSSLLSDLKNVMATNDVVRYRVYEVGWDQLSDVVLRFTRAVVLDHSLDFMAASSLVFITILQMSLCVCVLSGLEGSGKSPAAWALKQRHSFSFAVYDTKVKDLYIFYFLTRALEGLHRVAKDTVTYLLF